ncbi:hypothetical protein PMZ80_007748 [Knufia obscura]|uniref:RNA polymerase II holoenzyme cyclin-like subunit n=2 Tax=Knufia TaxID=430999 RepID=A0AAN8EMH7_9EURO|nr:hypothetical protein PMZ80_007748 [Knufia obscura]KAK5954282.1 hypothetical protein OHC33_004855 [Knufia fluminis]
MPSTPSSAIPSRPPIYYEDTDPQWLFTPTEFDRYTPSRCEGMDLPTEHLNRRKGINFITQVGISLKLDQITLATASIYFQRFYMRHPLQIQGSSKGAHHYQVAATAVYVAYKSKENPRKMHELIVAVSRVAQKDPNLMIDEQSKEFWKWRETIQHHENLMLEVLCFDLDPGLPYPVLFEILKYYNVQENKKLRNVSWGAVNDSFSTILCLLVQPQSVAGGCLYFALKHVGETLPDDEMGRSWWDTLGLNIEEMELVVKTILDTYQNPSVKGQVGAEVYAKDGEGLSFDLTRRLGTPSVEGNYTPRDVGGLSTNQIENKAITNGTENGHAEASAGGSGEQEQDRAMEDARSNGRSGSEEGELG